MKKNKNGFSFIELIVVIAIIAVLSVTAILSYGPSQRKSRDSRRMADLEKIRMALEMARQMGTTYPSSLNALPTMKLIDKIPTDPKPAGVGYSYARGETNYYTYGLWTSMEDLGSTNIPVSGNKNYKVTDP